MTAGTQKPQMEFIILWDSREKLKQYDGTWKMQMASSAVSIQVAEP